LLAASDCDVFALYIPHSGSGTWGAAANGAYVIVESAATAGSCPGQVVFVAGPQRERPSSWAVVVLTEEVWGATARVRAAAQLEVKLLVVALAAVSVAIEIALTLLIQLSSGVASRRHCAGERQVGVPLGRVVG